MPTYSEKFVANPVKFCEDHVIIVRHGGPPGRFSFKLTKAAVATAKTWYGKGVTVCDLNKVDDGAGDSFEAYWLPYNNNAQYQIELEDDADYMFTPTMDGCTFAVGGRDGGAVSVAHLNYQTRVDDPSMVGSTKFVIDQPKIETELSAIYDDGTVYVLRKGDYKSKEGHQITTYGVRNAKGWSFYYQKRRLTGSKVKSVDETTQFQGQTFNVKVKKSIEQYTFMGNHTGIRKV